MANIPEIDDKNLVKNQDAVKIVDIELSEIEDGIIQISDEDALDKNTKAIESTIRRSFEYKNYINYLKNGLNMNKCKFLPGLDASNIHVSLEMHHSPLTLFDIVQIIGRKHIEEDGAVDVFTIENEVMEEHYKNHVGLVPLSATLHELVHSQKITISPDWYFKIKRF